MTDADGADSSTDGDDGDSTAKKTGRGFLIITAAKVWFMITSAVIQLGLPIFFETAEQFGVFKIVTESISLINMVMITGTLQAVSKLVSERPVASREVIDRAVKLQCAIGLPVAGLYALGSPWIAASFNDPSLTPLLRLSSLIVAFYAFYAIFVGYLNGVKEFVKQASLDMTFATLKMVGIVGLVLLGFGVVGAVAGFVAAAAIICVVSAILAFFTLRDRGDDAEVLDEEAASGRSGRLLGYLVSIMLFNFALNGLMRVDLFVLKSVAADAPSQLAAASGIFKMISDKFAGLYGAVLNIARIPYQGVIAVTFVIFPLISESTFDEDLDRTREYIHETLRYCLLLIAPLGLAIAFNADSIVTALYSSDYAAASTALTILAVAVVFFALLYVATTIIVGSGHPVRAVLIMAGSLAVSAVLNYLFLTYFHADVVGRLTAEQWGALADPAAGSARETVARAASVAANRTDLAGLYLGEATDYMIRSATASGIAMAVGLVASVVWLVKAYGARPPVGTILRCLAGAGLFFAIDWAAPLPPGWVDTWGRTGYIGLVGAKMAGMGLAMLVLLLATGEFGPDDWDRLREVLGQ